MEKSLYDRVREIMDLELAEKEAKNKLLNTFMRVNGEVLYIEEFNYNADIIICFDTSNDCLKSIKYETLEVFLPKAGLYITPNGSIIHLKKVAKKQWAKSYTPKYYNAEIKLRHFNDELLLANEYLLAKLLGESTHKNIIVGFDKNIYFRDYVIGYVNNSNDIICTYNLFKQELIDWNNIYE